MVPQQISLTLAALEPKGVKSPVQPAVVARRAFVELFLGLPGLGGLIVVAVDHTRATQMQLGRRKVVSGRADRLNYFGLHVAHIFGRDPAAATQKAEAGHGVRMGGAKPYVGGGDAACLRRFLPNGRGPLAANARQIQRDDRHLLAAKTQNHGPGERLHPYGGGLAGFPHRDGEPTQLHTQRGGDVRKCFACFELGWYIWHCFSPGAEFSIPPVRVIAAMVRSIILVLWINLSILRSTHLVQRRSNKK